MKDILLIYIFGCLCSVAFGTTEYDESEDIPYGENAIVSDDNRELLGIKVPTSNCWMTVNAAEHFKILDEIDDRHAKIREEIQEATKDLDFDESLIQLLKQTNGLALREMHAHRYQVWMIPSGMNLGGGCMLRMPDSILFFHRMKLRNNTYFRVDWLHNDFNSMVLRINLSLNDLHLMGAYERSLTDNNPSVLIYAPTLGHVEFLLKDVKYKMEGRYRLIDSKFSIELISSEIIANDILMTYLNQAIESSAIRVEKSNLGQFLNRMKTDLDKWLKDYFNDLLIYAETGEIPHLDELAKYDKEKGTALEEFTDKSIQAIGTRIRLLNAENIRLPSFSFKTFHGLQVKLHDGVLNGLDSMYRRSVATGYKQNSIRKVDCLVGFSNLKVVYKYEAMIPSGLPPLDGVLTLSANELTAHLAVAMVSDPETVDLDIEFLDQMKPESLTVEGAANLMIANFKHLLEHQILAIMSNTLIHGVLMLKTLPRCEPFEPGQIQDKKAPEQNELSDNISDWHASLESEEMLRGETEPQGIATKYPKPLEKQSSYTSDKKKKETELKKYKRKSKKSHNRKQKIV